MKNIDLSLLYEQLGLNEWSKSKALNSVKQDYLNYSGHLFLGGSLQRLEGRSQAASSEFLLARLLQPANLNTFNTFNSYTSFFERPGIEGSVSGSIGNHDGRNADANIFGYIPSANIAFNVQGIYTDTDGWRGSNSERLSSLSSLLKWDPTPKDGFMISILHSNYKQEDRYYPRFEFDVPPDTFDFYKDRKTKYELGYHHNFSPNSDFLFLFSRLETDKDRLDHLLQPISNFIPLTMFELFNSSRNETPHYFVQTQQLFKIDRHNLTLGASGYWGDNDFDNSKKGFFTQNGNVVATAFLETRTGLDKQLQNIYLHDTWSVAPKLTIEGSLYFDSMENSNELDNTHWKLDEISPRLGLIWKFSNTDTLRLAAFRYLVPFSSSRSDPVDIAGITVLRNTQEGSTANEFDMAWEHEWSSGFLSTNLFSLKKEYYHEDKINNEIKQLTDHGRMDGFEAALNQLIGRGFGLAANYRYLDIDDESLAVAKRQEHLFIAGLRHVRKSGLSAGLFETYRFLDLKAPGRNNEGIWITDAQAGYEFPLKRGSIFIEARNIFNNRFNWVTDNFIFSGRNPARELLLKLSMNF